MDVKACLDSIYLRQVWVFPLYNVAPKRIAMF